MPKNIKKTTSKSGFLGKFGLLGVESEGGVIQKDFLDLFVKTFIEKKVDQDRYNNFSTDENFGEVSDDVHVTVAYNFILIVNPAALIKKIPGLKLLEGSYSQSHHEAEVKRSEDENWVAKLVVVEFFIKHCNLQKAQQCEPQNCHQKYEVVLCKLI